DRDESASGRRRTALRCSTTSRMGKPSASEIETASCEAIRSWSGGRGRQASVVSAGDFPDGLLVEELLVFGRTGKRRRRRLAVLDRLRHGIEVTGADFALMLDRGEALFRGGEFLVLHFDECGHVLACVAVRKLEHRIVQ